jgi:rhamnose utilization protein RhaD (predicted bifunctional aldolase and dehydrogenase)
MSLDALIDISRAYGSDSEYVLLGGGNTSYKRDGVLYVKASGHALGTIDERGFVKMDLAKLDAIWQKQYSDDDQKREEEVLADMMACRLAGEKSRPSVEALLHALLPFAYVVHLHPALVNGITCSQEGQRAALRLFPTALWIEEVKPGFTLAKAVHDRMKEAAEQANLIILQNHGIFVGMEHPEQIEETYRQVMQRISEALVRTPDFSEGEADHAQITVIKEELAQLTGEKIEVATNREVLRFLQDEEHFAKVGSAFTPDHIVYAGFKPLWVGYGMRVTEAYEAFTSEHGVAPKIICMQRVGAFSVGEKPLPLFLDTVAIAVYSESFGGPRFMSDEMIDFIRTWEAERYRSTVAPA